MPRRSVAGRTSSCSIWASRSGSWIWRAISSDFAGRDPESQPIEIIGLRPGEKLHEELFYDAELVEPTTSSKVLRARTTPPPSTIREDACEMLLMATGADEPGLRRAILEYARGLEGHPSLARDTPQEGPVFEHRATEAIPAGLSASS